MSIFEVIEPSEQPCPKCGGKLNKTKRPIHCEAYQCESCKDEFGAGYITGWVEANIKLSNPMPCGHAGRYAVNGEEGTQYCVMCVLEADKQTIANLVMVDVEETNEKCPFCQTRAILKRVVQLLDLTPEINSPHYDDVIANLINDTSSANSTFQCFCEETKYE